MCLLVQSNFLGFLEDSLWAAEIRNSLWLYPFLEIVHITGIVMLVGAALFFDIRLLGYARFMKVSAAATYLLPLSRKGLWLILPSGVLLFITNAKSLGVDPVFWLKMALLLIAAINVWIFHQVILKSAAGNDIDLKVPVSAKCSALISVIAWLSIIACGRLLAY